MKEKTMLQTVLAWLTGFAEYALACRAEYGEQDTLPGFRSAADLSTLGSAHYVFVMQTATRTAGLATNNTSSSILGVMQNSPKANEAMTIAYGGLSKVVAGGSVNAGDIITTNTSGRATAVGSAQIACGRALETASADGEIITALLFHPVRWTGAA